jgi:hypothetical protein
MRLLFGLVDGQKSLIVIFLIFVFQALKALPALPNFILLYRCELNMFLQSSLESLQLFFDSLAGQIQTPSRTGLEYFFAE